MLPGAPSGRPTRPPDQSNVVVPLKLAELPRASTIPACRSCSDGSLRVRMRSASSAVAPSAISSRPRSPYAVLLRDCVATAPTPAFAHGTMPPTLGNFDCTATPRSPFCGSRATML
jgi:hypothetical protein